MKNRRQGLGGILKVKTALVRSNREMFQEVSAARSIKTPRLSKVRPIIKKVENNNVTFVDIHQADPGADDDKNDAFLEGVPAVNHAQDLLVNLNYEEQYESASSAI